MKRPAIFFDRDNTLIAADGYLGDPAQVRLVSGSADAVARARSLGYATVVFSNQSGVARGIFDEDAVHAVNARLDQLLAAENPGAIIDRHEFCPYHPEGSVERYRQESELRKPSPGMIFSAARHLALDLERSWVVGDTARDIEAGQAAGCRTILFHDPELPPSPAAMQNSSATPTYVVSHLLEAMSYIEQNPLGQRAEESAAVLPAPSQLAPSMPIFSSIKANSAKVAEEATARMAASAEDRLAAAPPAVDLTKLETLAAQILAELRRRNDAPPISDFSVPRLFAGIAQVLALATFFFAYLNYQNLPAVTAILLLGLLLQCLTISLLVMGRQK